MTSLSNFSALAASLPTSLPATSTASPGVASSHYDASSSDQDNAVSQLISNLIDSKNESTSYQVTPNSTSSPVSYDIWSLPSSSSALQKPIGYGSRAYTSSRNNNQNHSREDNSSDSVGTSSSVSVTCFHCEERRPTTRCVQCNDVYCHECCHSVTSECQLGDHTLLPIHQVSPIGVRPNSVNNTNIVNNINVNNDRETLFCEIHNEPIKFYCDPCVVFICSDCTLWIHKDHSFSPITGALDICRIGIFDVIEQTKIGTKSVKAAIDRVLTLIKAFDKEAAEANLKIKKAMRCFAQAIEEREKYLLDKVERMRVARVNDLNDQMHTLRGILAGLAHTNETLVRSMSSDGIELLMAKDKGKTQVDFFCCMYKNIVLPEERIVFIPPNYDLLDQLKRQGDVLSTAVNTTGALTSASALQSRQSLLSLPYSQNMQTYPHYSYNMPAGNSLKSLPDYSLTHTRSTNFYERSITTGLALDSNTPRGIGQAVPGYWMSVTVRPTRNPVPGVPMLSFGSEGQDEGQVSRPWGLCVDKEGNIIVADRRNNRIQIFSSRGEFKSMFGSKGTGPGEFDLPAGITTDSQGRIIVIDKDNHRVQIFTSTGNFILKFGSFGKDSGQFQYPWDVAVNSLGNIVVTDTRNHRIQMFTSEGCFVTKFVFEGPNPIRMLKGPTTPRGVCYTASGNIIVSDFENHRLLMVDPSLTRVIQCVGREGSSIGELNRPSGIVSDDEGRIIVADSKNHRVLVFTPELRVMSAVDLKSPGLDDKDRPSDVALTLEGYLVVLFETLPDTARDISSHGKQYIKIY